MVDATWTCPRCGRDVPTGRQSCPTCGQHRGPAASERGRPAPATARAASSPHGGAASSGGNRASPPSEAADLARRLGHLVEWAEAARALGLALPRPPAWAEEAAGRTGHPELWEKAVHQLEVDTRRQVNAAFERMRERVTPRIARLQAYAVDTRLERDQLEQAMQAAQAGELALALSTFQQVDRVVALKERHLEQARDDLERLLALLRDVEAIGAGIPERVEALADELEADLRGGRLAALHQRIRSVRTRAADALRGTLVSYVARVGDRLVVEREGGLATDAEATDLAEGARRVLAGQVEEGARLLRRVGASRGIRAPSAGEERSAPASPPG